MILYPEELDGWMNIEWLCCANVFNVFYFNSVMDR